MLLLSTTVHSDNYSTPEDRLDLTSPDHHASGNTRWPCYELTEKRMKAAASFQVFRTVFCTAIIIHHVQKIQKIKKYLLAFPENLKGKSMFLKTKKMNHACHNAINH
jgi:hypothetical protein